MENDNKIVLTAVAIMFISMLIFSSFEVTGDAIFKKKAPSKQKTIGTGGGFKISLPSCIINCVNLIVENAYFVDSTGNKISSTNLYSSAKPIVVIKNSGVITANNFKVKIEILKDSVVKRTEIFPLTKPLKRGEIRLVVSSSNYKFTEDGSFHIRATVDSENKLKESNEKDNMFTTILSKGSLTVNNLCSPNWQCSSWGTCQPNNQQIRICTDVNNCNINAGKPTESQGCNYVNAFSPLTLSLIPFHEDDTVKVQLDFAQVPELQLYNQLGFVIAQENGLDYHPDAGSSAEFVKKPFQSRIYEKAVPNLKPNTDYQFCMSGFKSGVSTGNFNCNIIKTAQKQSETALIIRNYDIDQASNQLITQWLSEVIRKNPTLQITEITLPQGTTPDSLLTQLRTKYQSSNLKYVILIGRDLPIPTINTGGETIQATIPLTSLSSIQRGDFINEDSTGAWEVTISVIRPENPSQLSGYLQRLISFYQGTQQYNKKVLIADAMVPAESAIDSNTFVSSRYFSSDISRISGITNYADYSQGTIWKNAYKTSLSNSYELLLINAHGARTFHYPCDSTSCVQVDFIKQARPNSLFTIAISCNIGNFMTPNSPMVAYIFDGFSLTGLGAEVPYVDVNGNTVKHIFREISNFKTIGESARPFGFIIIGDPFLRLN